MKRNIILSTILATISGGLYCLWVVLAPVSVSIYIMFIGTVYLVTGGIVLFLWSSFCIIKQLLDDVQKKNDIKKGK